MGDSGEGVTSNPTLGQRMCVLMMGGVPEKSKPEAGRNMSAIKPAAPQVQGQRSSQLTHSWHEQFISLKGAPEPHPQKFLKQYASLRALPCVTENTMLPIAIVNHA